MKPSGAPGKNRHQPSEASRWIHPEMVWFAITFAALMALYYTFVLMPFPDSLMYSYLVWNAKATGAILNGLGVHCQVIEATIRLGSFAINVRRGCDAIEPSWFFCAAVVSFPGAWSTKVPALVAGTLVILAANLARLASLFLIGLHFPRLFSVAHLDIWPAAFIVLTMLLFVSWIYWVRKPARAAANAPA